jgi:hypothetical protein
MGIALTNSHASGGAAVITIAALDSSTTTNQCIELEMVSWSYDASPTGGNLKIESPSGTTLLTLDITSAGPGFIPFSGSCIRGAAGKSMIITLADGSVNNKVNVIQR